VFPYRPGAATVTSRNPGKSPGHDPHQLAVEGLPELPSWELPEVREGSLVGREAELARAERQLRLLAGHSGSIVGIVGEPGIGKTRFARQIAGLAIEQAVAVLWSRSLEDDWRPQYQMWDEVIGLALDRAGWTVGHDPAPDWAAPLVPVIPAIAVRYPQVRPLGQLTLQEEQFRIADAITRCLQDISARVSLVVVLDDLQWADRESLRVLRHAVAKLDSLRVLFVATIRSDELERSERLAEVVSWFRREHTWEEIRLGGLGQDHVRRMMKDIGDEAYPPELVRLVFDATQGNPFFVQEMTRHFIDEAHSSTLGDVLNAAKRGDLTVPDGLRQTVELRVSRLSARTQRMLKLAAVCTGGFDFPMLSALTSLEEDDLLGAIDEALAARLIVPVDGEFERYDFMHDLVRLSLYNSWSPSRRIRLHRALAQALIDMHGDAAYLHAAQIALHFHISAQVAGAGAGVPYALAAASQAERRRSVEEEATWYERALDLAATLPLAERADVACAMVLAQANALWLDRALESLVEALHLMREAGKPDGEQAAFIAQAVTSLHDGGAAPELWTPLLREGLALTPPEDEVTWARLTLLIERFEAFTVNGISGSRWLGTDPRATRIARDSGDEELFARSLQPWDLWDREWTNHLSDLVSTWQKPTAIIRALTVSGADWLYHHGEFRLAKAHFENLLAIARQQASVPGQAEALVRLSIIHAALGDLEDAHKYEREAAGRVERLGPGHRLHASLWWVRAFLLELELGDLREVAAFFQQHIADPELGRRTIAFDDAAMATLALARTNQRDDALALLTSLVSVLPKLEPTTWLLNGTVSFAATSVWEMRAADLAEPVYECALAVIDAGQDDYPCSSLHLSMARMLVLMDRLEDAHAAFDRARKHLDGSGQRPLRAMVDLDQARVLADGSFGDRDDALGLATAAHDRFASLGMTGWAARATSLLEAVTERQVQEGAPPAGLTHRELDVVRLVAKGYSDRAIGDQMYVSPRTVNAHVRNILAKTKAKNRTELSLWAVREGLVRHDQGKR
jgi:DNA-binding CsgD family transcriptional regulator/energy-coupling factor transporter ATP-binding protein EcfA2